jgi:hypothetical protein
VIAAGVALVVIRFFAEPIDPHAIAARYSRQCSGVAATTAACKRMQWQLEDILYQQLRAGAATTPEIWRIAAAADVPYLAALGLYRLADAYTPADDAIVLAQMDSPYRMVRDAAFSLADRMATDRGRKISARVQSDPTAAPRVADEAPSAARLGLPVYPGAVFRPFASGGGRATFTTADPPDKVAAFYTRAGHRPLTPDELTARQEKLKAEKEAAFANPQAIARKMQEAAAAGKDPQAVVAEMTAKMAGAEKDWTSALSSEEGVRSPRFVPIDEPAFPRVMVLFHDELVGATAVVFLEVPTAGQRAMVKLAGSATEADAERLRHRMEAMQLLARSPVDDP